MTNHLDLDELLRRHFDRAAASVDLRGGSVQAAKRTARRRQHRRRRAGVAVTAAAAVGVTGVGLQQLTKPDPQVSTGAPDASGGVPSAPPVAGSASAALERVDSAMTWNVVRPNSPESAVAASAAAVSSASAPALPGLMVSTQPASAGRQDYRRVLWRSDDGVNWTEVGALPDEATSAAVANVGSRVYALGTAPGARPGTVVARLTVSDDDGATWQAIDLPIGSSALAATPGIDHVNIGISSVAGTDAATMAVVREVGALDDWEAAWAQAGIDAATVSRIMPEGVEIMACEGGAVAVTTTSIMHAAGDVAPASSTPGLPCGMTGDAADVELVPWASLGAAGEALRVAAVPTQHLLRSADGVTFEEVALPAGGVDPFVVAVDDRIVFGTSASYQDPSMRLWESADGTSWAELPPPPFAVHSVGATNGRIVASGFGGDGSVVVGIIGVDGAWHAAMLDDLAGDGQLLGAMGGTMVATDHGITVGALLASGVDPNLDTMPGSTLPPATTSLQTPTTIPGTGGEIGREEPVILHSVDGVSWSVEHIADLLGMPAASVGSITRVQQVGDKIVVAVNLVSADPDVPPEQVVLVGTPNA